MIIKTFFINSKIKKIGNSYYSLIPKDIIKYLNLNKNDDIYLLIGTEIDKIKFNKKIIKWI